MASLTISRLRIPFQPKSSSLFLITWLYPPALILSCLLPCASILHDQTVPLHGHTRLFKAFTCWLIVLPLLLIPFSLANLAKVYLTCNINVPFEYRLAYSINGLSFQAQEKLTVSFPTIQPTSNSPGSAINSQTMWFLNRTVFNFLPSTCLVRALVTSWMTPFLSFSECLSVLSNLTCFSLPYTQPENLHPLM